MTGEAEGRGDVRGAERRNEDDASAARASMLARQKLIDAMIENNMRQLKFDSARGGAEIERACALRDCKRDPGASEPIERLRAIETRLRDLGEEQRRLIAEREWLNQSLFEFDQAAEAAGAESPS
jgi:hypothetical protein